METLTPNLQVKDVDTTIAWYKKYFDAQEIMAVPFSQNPSKLQWAMVACGSVIFMFQLQESFNEEFPVIKNTKSQATCTFYIQVKDIESLYKKLKNKIALIKDLHTTFYGTQEFAVQDCNGYVLVFAQKN